MLTLLFNWNTSEGQQSLSLSRCGPEHSAQTGLSQNVVKQALGPKIDQALQIDCNFRSNPKPRHFPRVRDWSRGNFEKMLEDNPVDRRLTTSRVQVDGATRGEGAPTLRKRENEVSTVHFIREKESSVCVCVCVLCQFSPLSDNHA